MGLNTVISAGEACSAELAARWALGRAFVNAYGPTETTVCASMYACAASLAGPPPIGRPIANSQLYVLDRHMRLLPAGVPGELYVGGVNLARGYLRRPGLTADRFVPDPFGRVSGARLYRTGDLVRYRPAGDGEPDGNIEFLGRVDHQVKVRGFRIELGEIESVLNRHPAIQEAVVLARDDVAGDRRLVAYAVAHVDQDAGPLAAGGGRPAVDALRSYVRESLPDYMVPSAFVYLTEWPLSPSGKIDRKRLPALDGDRPELGREYVAPRTPTEVKLAEMCGQLLGIDAVGVHDSFFELGGHSLLATQFAAKIKDELGVEVPLRVLFERPSVSELARYVQDGEAEQVELSTIADLLGQVSRLGETEVQTLLADIQQADPRVLADGSADGE